jgi:hypothetical protein
MRGRIAGAWADAARQNCLPAKRTGAGAAVKLIQIKRRI